MARFDRSRRRTSSSVFGGRPAVHPRRSYRQDMTLISRRNLVARVDYEGKGREDKLPNPNVVFLYDPSALSNGLIAR